MERDLLSTVHEASKIRASLPASRKFFFFFFLLFYNNIQSIVMRQSYHKFPLCRSIDTEETFDGKWIRLRLDDSPKCLIVLNPTSGSNQAGVFDDCTMPVGSERELMLLLRMFRLFLTANKFYVYFPSVQ